MKRTVSYIFPMYNEAENVSILYKTMSSLLDKNAGYNYEIIFVNDGSKDNTLAKLLSLQKIDGRIFIINFSRNFGHQIAVTAGLDYATGDAVIIMDSDMQDPPKVSMELIKKWEKGYEVVYAQRRTRKDGAFKKLTASIYYRVLDRLADINIPKDTGDFRLLDRKVVDSLKTFHERNRFLRGMVSFIGFKQTAVLFDRDERHAGKTGYPLKKMLKFAVDGILGFSSAPIKFMSKLGFLMSGASFLGILYALVEKAFYTTTTVPGWTFIVIAVLFVGGIQLIMLGVLGSYIGRIYSEVQGRPLYIVSDIFGSTAKATTQKRGR